MKKVIASIAALAATLSLTAISTAPAAAQGFGYGYGDRYRYVERYCDRYPGDRDCYDFGRYGNRWDDRRYNDWYYSHYGNGAADAAIAGIFGLMAGAIASGALNSQRNVIVGSGHEQRCAARFKSYDPGSDSYLGYDGRRHACNL